MVDFKARIYDGDNNQMIGAEVTVFSKEGDNIGSIKINSTEDLERLQTLLSELREASVLKENLQSEIDNISVNAATLNDYSSIDFALSNHNHGDSYAPKKHDSAANTYGLGSQSAFGHVKVIDDLSHETYNEGEALSAKQGNKLSNDIKDVIRSNSTWQKVTNYNYLDLFYNSALKLCYCRYNRENVTTFTKAARVNVEVELHGANTIPQSYQPHTRVISPMYRGDIVMFINTDGSVSTRSQTQLSNAIGLHCSWMWPVL